MSQIPYTLEPLEWTPWVEPISNGDVTPELGQVWKQIAPGGKLLPFYAVLAHDPESLIRRMHLYHAIMYGPPGLTRSERELVGAAVSRLNGCVYCTSNHGRTFISLSKRTDLTGFILTGERPKTLSDRERAMLDFAKVLTTDPAAVNSHMLQGLLSNGMTQSEVWDLCQVTSMFAWANRLAQGLGDVGEHGESADD